MTFKQSGDFASPISQQCNHHSPRLFDIVLPDSVFAGNKMAIPWNRQTLDCSINFMKEFELTALEKVFH